MAHAFSKHSFSTPRFFSLPVSIHVKLGKDHHILHHGAEATNKPGQVLSDIGGVGRMEQNSRAVRDITQE